MQNELVSIIVPIYNAEKFLARCIESLTKQTYQSLEIILINDGSKDNSLAICNDFKKKDKRIVVIDQENSGVGKTRNKGIAVAKGKYIVFVDSDDYANANLVEELVKKASEDNSDYVLGGISLIKDGSTIGGALLEDKVLNVKEYVESVLLKKTINYVCGAPYSKLFRTDVIRKHNINFDEKLTYAEDFLFNINYLQFASKISTTSAVLYNYILFNNNSLTNINYDKSLFEDFLKSRLYVYKNYEEILEKINPDLDKKLIHQLLVEFVLNSANYACIKNNKKDAKNYIKSMVDDEYISMRIKNANMSSKKENFKLKLLNKRHFNLYYLFSTLKGRKR